MFIKGITEYDRQGNEVKTGMVFGRATKDADHRRTNSGKDIKHQQQGDPGRIE